MNETTPEPDAGDLLDEGGGAPPAPARALQLVLEPLPVAGLSPAVKALATGPSQAKAMAAKGITTLRPGELLTALYQISFDPDPTVKGAMAGVGELPDAIIVTALKEPLPPRVLDWFARLVKPARTAAIEAILYNQATSDETFVVLASLLPERELEIIFHNEQRLLRHPAILQALYYNPHARMSSLNRALELCARNQVRVEGIPAYDEIVKSLLEDSSSRSGESDQSFEEILRLAEGVDPSEADDEDEGAPGAPAGEKKKKSAVIDFGKLKLHEKIRLATLGNAYCRSVLMRDSNKVVALSAIRSPGITDMEVVRAASSRQVCEDIIRYIANRREYMRMGAVRQALVRNPKCPLPISMKLVSTLQNEEIKAMARSKSVPSALSAAARRLVQQRKLE